MYLSIHFLLVPLRYLQLTYVLYGFVAPNTHRNNYINLFSVTVSGGIQTAKKVLSKHFSRFSVLPLVYPSSGNHSYCIIFFTNNIGRKSQNHEWNVSLSLIIEKDLLLDFSFNSVCSYLNITAEILCFEFLLPCSSKHVKITGLNDL